MLPPPKNVEVIMTPLIVTKISAAYVTLVRYMTNEDVATDLAWVNCKRSCNWWIHHACCVGIHYENTEKAHLFDV